MGNNNVDYLSRLEEEIITSFLTADFPDEHLFSILEEEDMYGKVQKYLSDQVLPPSDKHKEKACLLKLAPYTIVKGGFFKIGLDYKLRRGVNKKGSFKVLQTFH